MWRIWDDKFVRDEDVSKACVIAWSTPDWAVSGSFLDWSELVFVISGETLTFLCPVWEVGASTGGLMADGDFLLEVSLGRLLGLLPSHSFSWELLSPQQVQSSSSSSSRFLFLVLAVREKCAVVDEFLGLVFWGLGGDCIVSSVVSENNCLK